MILQKTGGDTVSKRTYSRLAQCIVYEPALRGKDLEAMPTLNFRSYAVRILGDRPGGDAKHRDLHQLRCRHPFIQYQLPRMGGDSKLLPVQWE